MEQTDAACLCDEEPFSPIVDPAERLAGLPQWPGLSHNTRETADYTEAEMQKVGDTGDISLLFF